MDNATNRDENIIKRVRREYNLSIEDVSEITGVKVRTLQNYSSTGEVSETVTKCIEWFIKYKIEEDKTNNINYLKKAFNRFLHD